MKQPKQALTNYNKLKKMLDISNDHAVGIDIGGTNTKYGIVNHRGQIVFEGCIKTDAYPLIGDFINSLHEKLQP